uniref:Hydrophobin n=2 Tax=Tricholoma TaxID=40144 RepID=A0A024BLL7_9AGAR|nr:hydrophobin 1 [Tricholoma vaccinum]
MFSKVVVFVAALAAFVAASPVPGADSQCNTGPVQCCNSVYQSQSQEGSLLASLVGANVQDANLMAGIQCSPITAIGLGSGSKCSQQPVCCSGNHMNGLVVVGCSPVNL